MALKVTLKKKKKKKPEAEREKDQHSASKKRFELARKVEETEISLSQILVIVGKNQRFCCKDLP